mgnify:CR=1 FL=1
MRQVSYKAQKNLVKNIIFLDGLNRSGKLLLGSLVSSLKNMESLEFGENFEHFLPAMKFQHVSSNFSKSFLMNYLNQLIYNKMISRNSNFRPYDRTGIPRFHSPKIYKKRLKMKEGDIVIKRIKTSNFFLPIVTHDLMSNYNELNKLNIKFSIIQIFRNPFELVYSWYKAGLGKRWGKDPRIFSLTINKNKENFPWYVYDRKVTKDFKKLNQIEKCSIYVNSQIERTIKNLRKLKFKKNLYITDYFYLVENPHKELKNIAKFLKTNFSRDTKKHVKREKCPNLKIRNLLERKKTFIKKKVKKEIFIKLLDNEKKYRNNIYNLRKF